ncbi:hypothetical protein AALO_G00010910, partial [Alosa alosa]
MKVEPFLSWLVTENIAYVVPLLIEILFSVAHTTKFGGSNLKGKEKLPLLRTRSMQHNKTPGSSSSSTSSHRQ